MKQVVITSMGYILSKEIEEKIEGKDKTALLPNVHFITCDETLSEELMKFIPLSAFRRYDKLTKMALLGALRCIGSARLAMKEEDRAEVGCVFNTAFGPQRMFQDFLHTGINTPQGLRGASPLMFPFTVINASSGVITTQFKLNGFNTTLSGYNPICYAFDTIVQGNAKALLTGAFDEVTPDMIEAYSPSIRNLTEGSSMVLLEEKEYALQNHRTIVFTVVGYSIGTSIVENTLTVDNYSTVNEGKLASIVKGVINRTGIHPNQIGLVAAFGGNEAQHAPERNVIRRIWGEEALLTVLQVKQKTGDAISSNDLLVYPILKHYLDENPNATTERKPYILVNNFLPGGNITSVIIRQGQ